MSGTSITHQNGQSTESLKSVNHVKEDDYARNTAEISISHDDSSIISNKPNQKIVRSQTMPPGSRSYGTSGQLQCATNTSANNEFESKIANLKAWSINTYRCTKQVIQEKLGRAVKTVDVELESKVDLLRDTQLRYRNLLENARKMTDNFRSFTLNQKTMSEIFIDLKQRQPDLEYEFSYNAQTQATLYKSGQILLNSMDHFVIQLNTLCNSTMEDTVRTIRNYQQARVQFDAYRREAEALHVAAASRSGNDPFGTTKALEASQRHQNQRSKFERLKHDVEIKLRFLEENKIRVMQSQLLLFHNGITAYFANNQVALEAVVKQFSIHEKSGNDARPSWIERQNMDAASN